MFKQNNKNLVKAPRPNILSRIKIFRMFFRTWAFDGLNIKSEFLKVPKWQAVIATLLLFILAIPSYAYTSTSVVNGTLLYSVKKGLESIEYSLASSEEEKTEKDLKFAEKRLDEVSFMLKEKKDSDEVVEVINELKETFVKVSKSNVDEPLAISKHDEKIKIIAKGIKLETERVVDSLAKTIEELNKVNTHKNEDILKIEENLGENKVHQELVEERIRKIKNNVDQKIKDLKGEYRNEDLFKLKGNLNNKIQKAEEAMIDKNEETARNYIEKTRVLNNNAEYFVRQIVDRKTEKQKKKK